MSSYKDTFLNLLVKTHFTEEKDEREYDYEGDMAKSQLKSIITNAQRLHDMLDDDTNLPEWVQGKITLAEDYVLTAANYMESEEDLDEEVEQVDEQSPAEIKAKYYHDQFDKVKPVKAYDKEGKLVGRYRSMDHAKQMKPGHTYKVEEEIELDEAFDKSSPAHAKAQELVSNYGNRSAARAVYHGDGSATIHTTGDKKVSSATRVDHIHDQAGLGYNRSAEAYKNSSKSKGGLKFKTKETEGKSIYGSHEIHISHNGMKEEVELDEAQKKLKPSYWKAEWRLGTQSEVDKNNKKIFDKLAKTDPVKAAAFHDNLMRMKKKDVKEEVEEVDEGAKDWKKAFGAVAQKNLKKDIGKMRSKVSRFNYIGMQPKVDMTPKVTAAVSKKGSTKVDEEVRYFSGTTVSGKPWKFIPPGEPKMLSPEFVKDRVPTLTDKEAHEVSVVAKDQYNDVEKKFAEMSEANAGTVPKTPREKELAAKAHPKHLITRKDVLHARGVKLGEEELREKIREKLGAPGKTMTKKPADPVVFHPLGKKKAK